MHILHLLQIKSITADFKIGRLKDTDIEGLPAVYQNPLAKVKLATIVDKEWPFNIFLHNLLLWLSVVSHNFSKVARAENTKTPCIVTRLNDPDVSCAIDLPILGQLLLQCLVQSHDLKLFISCEASIWDALLHHQVVKIGQILDLSIIEKFLRYWSEFSNFFGFFEL